MTVYLAHATSFCAGVWRPVIQSLDPIQCVAWDFAGHGRGPVIELPVDWSVFGEQVIAETRPGGIGVGHSMGGTAVVMAQLADPGRFRALVLIEPIIFPGPHGRAEHDLSLGAVERRDTFADRAEALAHFRSREALAGWHPAAVEGYVDCGLVEGVSVRLACRPEVEADVYRGSNAHDTWERLGEIEVPVLILAGAETDTVSPRLAREQGAQFKKAGVEVVAGAGHFLPMEKPGLVADRARRLHDAV